MNIRRARSGALALAALVPSCASTDLDGSDREAFFAEARVRKQLDGTVHDGSHVELDWNLAEGDAEGVDFSIHTTRIGLGADRPIGEAGWAGISGGLAWQRLGFDGQAADLDGEDDFGPYGSIQGGWMATPWLEAYSRADLCLYVPDFGTSFGFEVGARFHVIERTALFAGWRYARYDIADVDYFTSIEAVELDVSGLVLGIELAF